MAEIEVLLDFGRPYVRLDDYNEMKERYWSQVTKTQDADGEAAKWQERARALLARAEAAEALAYERLEAALFAEQERDDADLRAEAAEAEAARLAARVADLEAQLAAEREANEWRTDTLPHNGVIQALVTVVVSDGVTRQWGPGGNLLSVFRWRRPIPPPPQEEPTP